MIVNVYGRLLDGAREDAVRRVDQLLAQAPASRTAQREEAAVSERRLPQSGWPARFWYLPAVQRLGYPKTTHAELLLP